MTGMLAVADLGVAFGGLTALDGVSFKVAGGEILALIGPNGAGKTTLFNLISGVYRPGRGTVILAGENVTSLPVHELARRGLARTFQNLQIFTRMSAIENVMVGRHLHESRNALAHLFTLPSVLRQNRATRERARELLARVGLADLAERPAGALPYGALRRLEIARAWATEPKVLLLDEPAAGCNPVETEELDGLIKRVADEGIAVVLVEHDMRLVMKLADRIHVLNYGRTLAEGNAGDIRNNPAVISAYLGTGQNGERPCSRSKA